MAESQVQMQMVARAEVREVLMRAEAKLAHVRGDLLELGATLAKTLASVDAVRNFLRVQTLGRTPANLEGMIVTDQDVAELRAATDAVLRLVDSVAAVTTAQVAPAPPST